MVCLSHIRREMLKVYVTEMPEKADDCPFFMDTNKKCNICNDKCCLNRDTECVHLLTLNFSFDEGEQQ